MCLSARILPANTRPNPFWVHDPLGLGSSWTCKARWRFPTVTALLGVGVGTRICHGTVNGQKKKKQIDEPLCTSLFVSLPCCDAASNFKQKEGQPGLLGGPTRRPVPRPGEAQKGRSQDEVLSTRCFHRPSRRPEGIHDEGTVRTVAPTDHDDDECPLRMGTFQAADAPVDARGPPGGHVPFGGLNNHRIDDPSGSERKAAKPLLPVPVSHPPSLSRPADFLHLGASNAGLKRTPRPSPSGRLGVALQWAAMCIIKEEYEVCAAYFRFAHSSNGSLRSGLPAGMGMEPPIRGLSGLERELYGDGEHHPFRATSAPLTELSGGSRSTGHPTVGPFLVQILAFPSPSAMASIASSAAISWSLARVSTVSPFTIQETRGRLGICQLDSRWNALALRLTHTTLATLIPTEH